MLHFLFPATKHFSEKNLEVGTGEEAQRCSIGAHWCWFPASTQCLKPSVTLVPGGWVPSIGHRGQLYKRHKHTDTCTCIGINIK